MEALQAQLAEERRFREAGDQQLAELQGAVEAARAEIASLEAAKQKLQVRLAVQCGLVVGAVVIACGWLASVVGAVISSN